MPKGETLEQVGEFWGTEACGTHFVREFADQREFYQKFREQRYRTEWHIPLLVPFQEAQGKKVLEIGIGNGADGVMFAQNGADYTGVDLTQTAIDATRRHFELEGLSGTFQREDAESLSLADNTFDLVYSHGVLHHTPHTQRAIDEVWRVLKPGGKAIIMLYHKGSFNYVVRIMIYMRLRVLLRILSRAGHWDRDRSQLESEKMVGLRGNQDNKVWDIHYQNFLREGWRYLKPENFVHHCTDGPECPVAYAFDKREAASLFSRFKDIGMTVAHFPIRRYGWGRWFPFSFEKWLASHLGWYLFIYARKPTTASSSR